MFASGSWPSEFSLSGQCVERLQPSALPPVARHSEAKVDTSDASIGFLHRNTLVRQRFRSYIPKQPEESTAVMAKLSDLIPTLAQVLPMPEQTVAVIARSLRQERLLSTGGRG